MATPRSEGESFEMTRADIGYDGERGPVYSTAEDVAGEERTYTAAELPRDLRPQLGEDLVPLTEAQEEGRRTYAAAELPADQRSQLGEDLVPSAEAQEEGRRRYAAAELPPDQRSQLGEDLVPLAEGPGAAPQ